MVGSRLIADIQQRKNDNRLEVSPVSWKSIQKNALLGDGLQTSSIQGSIILKRKAVASRP